MEEIKGGKKDVRGSVCRSIYMYMRAHDDGHGRACALVWSGSGTMEVLFHHIQ